MLLHDRKISAHLEVRPPSGKIFGSWEGEAPAEPKFRQIGSSAIRQVGKSANRQIGNLASQRFVNSGGQQTSRLVIGKLVIGELTVVLACIPRPPSLVPIRFRLTRMFALHQFRQIGMSANRQVGKSASWKYTGGSCSCTTENFRLTWKFALQKVAYYSLLGTPLQ
ncbi:MAG: hypothetical protein ACK4I8_04415 [Armatimonadota bacterium]